MKSSISKDKLRSFGLLLGLVIPIFIGWILPAIKGHSFLLWTLMISLPLLNISVLKPSLLYYPYLFWNFIGEVLGTINSHLILGIIFIFVLQPIAIILKFFNYDPLKLKNNNKISYRIIKKNKKIDFTKIF